MVLSRLSGRAAILRAAHTAAPEEMPARISRNVDLPQPEGPRMETIFPSGDGKGHVEDRGESFGQALFVDHRKEFADTFGFNHGYAYYPTISIGIIIY
jgi:hypothetical protein